MPSKIDRITGLTTDHAGAVRAMLEAGAALATPARNPDADGEHYVLTPPDWTVERLPVQQHAPRPTGRAKLRDAASFIAYVNAHKVGQSRLYASLEPARFLAVFDDYARAPTTEDQAAWRDFRAEFLVPPSREWTVWKSQDRKPMTQLAFGEWLQDQLPDVVQPDGAELLEMAMNFEASSAGSFVAAQRLRDGSHNLAWKADNNAAGSVRLPEHISLSIPVFENEQPRDLQARLRYRVAEGKLSIWYELVRPHKVLEAAFRECWHRIATETALPILLGEP